MAGKHSEFAGEPKMEAGCLAAPGNPGQDTEEAKKEGPTSENAEPRQERVKGVEPSTFTLAT